MIRISYECIEKKLIPVGLSGIEDLLQDDVALTINVISLNVFLKSSIYVSVV